MVLTDFTGLARVAQLLVVMMFVGVGAPAAVAGAPVGTEVADAEALIAEGIALRRKRDDAAALQRFQQAFALTQTPRAMAQIGLAEQALGRWVSADKHLRQGLELGQKTDDSWIRKNRASIETALAVVRKRVGHLEVTGSPVGAEVRVDGELAGRLPLPGPLVATVGQVAVEVRAPGFLPIMRGTTVVSGNLAREIFNLQALRQVTYPAPLAEVVTTQETLSPPRARLEITKQDSNSGQSPDGRQDRVGSPSSLAAASPADDVGTSSRRIAAFTAGGAAILALGLGVYEHLVWQTKVKSFGSMAGCGTMLHNRGAAGCFQLYEDGQTARLGTFVSYGLSTALAITSIVLFLGDGVPPEPDSKKLACAVGSFGLEFSCRMIF